MAITVTWTGLNAKADQAGFIAVYPNGTGVEAHRCLNSGFMRFRTKDNPPPDDVAFTAKLLDDLATVVNVDPKRVYATGVSNGGMMCYRLAAELSDRIAAIAAVAGARPSTISPKRPVPVLRFPRAGRRHRAL